MPFVKNKKGAAGGLTALALFGMFILLSNFVFYALKEAGIMSEASWIENTIMSTLFMFTFIIMYYVCVRNVHEQGKQAGMLIQEG